MDLSSTSKFGGSIIANVSQGTSSTLRQTTSELAPEVSTQLSSKPMGTSKPLKRKRFLQSDDEFITLKNRKMLLELEILEEDLAEKRAAREARQRREKMEEELIQARIQFFKAMTESIQNKTYFPTFEIVPDE